MEVKKFIAILKQHYKVVSDEDLAKVLYMTQPAITHWKRRGIPKKVLKRYGKIIEQFEEKGETINVKSKDISVFKEDSKVEMGADYIIELQKDKIETQTQEIKELKEIIHKKQAESTHWEALEYDYICHVVMFREGIGFGRIMESVSDLDTQSRILGYSLEELTSFWDCGKKHTTLEGHPVENMINSETQKEIQQQVSTLSMIFDAMKTVGGNHYIPQPIIYKHKNGANIGAISYNKVEWSHLKIVSKVKFLLE